MKIRDCKEILRWTFLSGVLTFAALGATVASSDQAPKSPFNSAETTVNGLHYKLEQVASDVPHVVKVQVTVENQTDRAEITSMSVSLISGLYKGPAGGRVASPGDFEETIHDRKTAHEAIPSSVARVYPASLKAKPVTGNPRWGAKLAVDGKVVLAIEIKPG